MMDPFVIDSSIAMGWVHPSQATELTQRLLEKAKEGSPIIVPGLWHLEIANALLVAVRRKLMTHHHRQTALALLNQLKVITDSETSSYAFSTISELAIKGSCRFTMRVTLNWRCGSRCRWPHGMNLCALLHESPACGC